MCYKLPGPRCSSHAFADLRRALREGNEEDIRAAKIAYATTPRGLRELAETGQVEKVEKYKLLRQKMMAEYTKTMNIEDLQMELIDRVEGEEFEGLLNKLHEAEENYSRLYEERQEDERIRRRVNGAALSWDDETRRRKIDELREAKFARIEAKADVEEFKDETGHIAARLADLVEVDFREYEGETLGRLVRLQEFPSGSREWHKQRQEGIGGSDVGAILQVDPNWGAKNAERVWESKLVDFDAMSDDEFQVTAEKLHRAVEGASDRGNAWEPVLAEVFASKNPEYKLLHSKYTWVDPEDPVLRANFDGLLSSREDGEPDGILEIKTSSHREDWEDENGNPIVPAGYRAQVLHYLEVTGFDYAYIAVQIDDKEYRQYRIERGEPITPEVGTWRQNEGKLREFMEKAAEKREAGERDARPYWKRTTRPRPAHPQIRTEAAIASATSTVAALSDEDETVLRERINSRISAGEDSDSVLRDEFNRAITETPYTGDYVVFDIETTGGFPASGGEVIEIGWTRLNSSGEVVDEDNLLLSPDSRVLRAFGTGFPDYNTGGSAADVHGITPEEVAGQPSFRDPNVQRRVRDAFAGARLVAHNAVYEKGYMNQDLAGFQEAGFKFLDTQKLSEHFEINAESNSLESFAQANNVEYVNAHRALNDAQMTATALFGFLNNRRLNNTEDLAA